MAATQQFKLRVLGGLTIERVALTPTPVLVPKSSLAILALLAAAGPSGISRDKLMAYRWPDRDTEHARNSLDQALFVLRRALGADSLTQGSTDLRLNPDVVVSDLGEFEEARGRGNYERAVSSFGGPFLDGFHLRAAGEFERWVDGERARIGGEYADVIGRLASAAESRSDWQAAAQWWRRLGDIDPLSSRVALAVMRSLAKSGARAEALRYAREHEELVRQELDVEPDASVAALVDELRRENGSALREIASRPPLLSTADASSRDETSSSPSASADHTDRRDAPSTSVPARSRRRASRTSIALITVSCALAVLVVAAWAAAADSASLDSHRVVVFFRPELGRHYATALGNDLTRRLVDGLTGVGIDAVPGEHVKPPGRLRRVLLQVRFGESQATARAAGAATIVAATFRPGSDSVRLGAELIEAATGRVIRQIQTLGGPSRDGAETEGRFREQVMVAVATHLEPRLTLWGSVASQPRVFESYREYKSGLDRFFADDYEAARRHFYRAVSLDSGFTAPLIWVLLTHMYWKSTWVPTKELPIADSLARELEKVRERLWPWDRLMLDERVAVLRADNERAYDAMRQLAGMAPSSEWTWLLARHAVFTNRPRVAIEALEKLDPEQGWMSGFGPYWSFLLDAQHMNGNYEDELSTARRSRERYLNNPFSLTFRHARALLALGRIQEARLLIDSLTVTGAIPLNEYMERALLGYMTSEARAHGHPEVAREWSSLDSASHPLAPFAPGMKESEAIRALQVLQRRERWAEAQPFAKYLVEVNPSYDDYHLLLGIGAAHVGDRTEALRQAEWFSRQQRPYEHGGQRLFQARIVAALGDKAGAVELIQRAFNEGTKFDAFLHWGWESLKDYAPYQELMRPRR